MGRYLVWNPENGQIEEDATKISAYDPECAVREWAEWSDRSSAEYHIVGGTSATVLVRDLDAPTALLEYTASGESMPVYYARHRRPGIEPATKADRLAHGADPKPEGHGVTTSGAIGMP